MNQHQCRRHKKIEVNDERVIVRNVTVFDPTKDYSLFPECKQCGYGHKMFVLKTREALFETYEIKGCTLRKV